MHREYVVYGLCDPRDLPAAKVRYVGCTVRKLSNRLRAHVKEAIDNVQDTLKVQWIRRLLWENVEPIAVVLETFSKTTNWEERERWWINKLAGTDLLNATLGGIGAYGH